MKKQYINLGNDQELFTYIFDTVTEVKGIVQILHGVNEHGKRYTEFANHLNQNGYVVYLSEHICQGENLVSDTVDFGKNGKQKLIDGMIATQKEIQKIFPDKDIYLFGHSLGALITRNYLLKHNNPYKKIVLNGTGLSNVKGIGILMIVGKILSIFKGSKPSKMFDNVFRSTQLKLNEKTPINHFIEWLTRDEKYTLINKSDTYLFVRLSVDSFRSILKLVIAANNTKQIAKNYDKNTSILLLSGTHDPSTNFGEDTKALDQYLIKLGINSKHILYEEGRHDTLQEINREQVFNDILDYIES